MDCRKSLMLGWCLLATAAGCAHQVATLPVVPPVQAAYTPPAPVAPQAIPADAVVKRDTELPRKTPLASTCVARGDFYAKEAESPGLKETLQRDYREMARLAFQQALSIDPHCLAAYESLAALYTSMKDHAHAVATYSKATQTFPNEPRVFFDLGVCQGGEKEWDLALQNLARAVELDPENRQYVDTLGWMQARAGRYDDSLQTFTKVHGEAEAHYKLALMLEHLKQTELCRQQLQAALDKDPQMDKAQALLTQLDGRAAGPVQTTSYAEPAKPAEPAEPARPVLTDVAPARPVLTDVVPAKPVLTDVVPAPQPQPSAAPEKAAPASHGLILPPPPRFPIHYESAPPAPPAAVAPAKGDSQ